MSNTKQAKVLLPVIIRAVLLIAALFIKAEVFGIRVTFILIAALAAWSAVDFFRNRKRLAK